MTRRTPTLLTRRLAASLLAVLLTLGLVGDGMAWPNDPLDVKVELYLGSSTGWADITSDVLVRDGIRIQRGFQDEVTSPQPGSMTLTLRNTNGKYTPRNPSSPYYGLIGRNTPIRVSVGGVLPDVEEGFEDTDYDITFTGDGSRSTSNPRTGSGHWQMSANFAGTAEIDVTVPPGATSLTLWYQRTTKNCTFEVLLDDVEDLDTGSGTDGDYVSTTHDVTDVSTVTLRLTDSTGDSVNAALNIDDLTFSGIRSYRFHGEVSEWPPRWDVSGQDVYVPITAQGILRRLGQGSAPTRSPLRRWYDRVSPQPVAYWPLEDRYSDTATASAARVGPPMRYFGLRPEPGDGLVPAGAASGVRVVGGKALAAIGPTSWIEATGLDDTPPSEMVIDFWLALDDAVAIPDTVTGSVLTLATGSDPVGFSEAVFFQVTKNPSDDTFFSLFIFHAGGTGGNTHITEAAATALDGYPHNIRLVMENNGADVDYEIFLDGESVVSDTATAVNLPGLSAVLPVRTASWIDAANSFVATAAVVVTNFAVWDDASAPSPYEAGVGYVGEQAHERIERILTTEAGVPVAAIGSESVALGFQPVAPPVEVATEAAEADVGLQMFESRHELGITFRTRRSLYNQAATLSLDYDQSGDVAPNLNPIDDDQNTRNRVVVKRKSDGAESAVAELTSGPLSTQDPPDGVGVYDEELTLNLADDVDPDNVAQWLLHVGTWDEPRIPDLTLNLTAMAAAGNPDLVADAASLDVGDRITITNLPAYSGFVGTADLMVIGFREYIDPFNWRITV